MLDINRYWYRESWHPLTICLLPFSWLFGLISGLRRWLYSHDFLKSTHFDVPVIVVGNITVGGTGKTPFVIWLANYLQLLGYQPAIVSRGYGGKKHTTPHWVTADATAEEVGDEPVAIAKRVKCPVVVCTDRVAAVNALLQKNACNVIVADDGLQHYRLGRQIEIAIVDGYRRFGNMHLLPAGPLREPIARLAAADFVLINGDYHELEMSMELMPEAFVRLQDGASQPAFDFPAKTVHAVAGIGHPERFFTTLRQLGLEVIPHAFPDHYRYQAADLQFADGLPVVMTEKDAVKCYKFANKDCWYLQVDAKIDRRFQEELQTKLQSLEVRHDPENDFTICRRSDSPIQHSSSVRSK